MLAEKQDACLIARLSSLIARRTSINAYTSERMPFTLIQIIYWTSLSIWFGGVLFIAIAPMIILKTVRENNPILPGVLSVNLDGQHGTLLGSLIVGDLANYLVRIELISAGVLLIAIVGQWIILAPAGTELIPPLVRAALYLIAAVLLIYKWRVTWPRMIQHRTDYIDHADEPEKANPALDELNRYQVESTRVLFILTGALLLLILMSASIAPKFVVQLPPA